MTRYISGQLMLTVLSVITVLTCIIWLAQSLKFVELVASKGVTIWIFLQLIFFLLPNLVIIVIPIAVLTAVLFIYNKLITDHELLVMQSSGFSYWHLAKPALLVALLFTAIMYIFTLYILPISARNFRDLEWSLKQVRNINVIQPGQFTSVGHYTIYVRKKLPNNEIKGVLIYDMSDPERPVTHMAEYGVALEDKERSRLILFNGNTQDVDIKTGKPNILYFNQYTLETEGGKRVKKRKVKHHELFLGELLYPDEGIKDSTRLTFLAEGHQRIISPLYSLIFAAIGLCFLLVFPYNRRGRVPQIVGAAATACLFYVIALVLLNMQGHLALTILILYTLVITTLLWALWMFSGVRLFGRRQ